MDEGKGLCSGPLVLCAAGNGTSGLTLFALTSMPFSLQSYEVKSVLGREVGLASCFVQSITTHPTSCIGLEEIKLQSAGGTSAERPPQPQDL